MNPASAWVRLSAADGTTHVADLHLTEYDFRTEHESAEVSGTQPTEVSYITITLKGLARGDTA